MRKNLDIHLTLIFMFSFTVVMLWPLEDLVPTPNGIDKIVHLTAFAALVFPLAQTGRIGLLPVFFGACAFGGAIELIQPSFNRSADMNDWLADTLGALIGVGSGRIYNFVKRQHF